jgi:hypothetical protein
MGREAYAGEEKVALAGAGITVLPAPHIKNQQWKENAHGTQKIVVRIRIFVSAGRMHDACSSRLQG